MKKILPMSALLIFALRIYAQDSSSRADSVLFITADMLAWCDNLEFFNDYREGYLHLGAYVRPRFEVRPSERFSFAFGVHVRKAFGDEDFFSDARPVFRGRINRGNFSFLLGEVISANRHGLPDALMREEFLYDPAIEEGFQFLYKGKTVQQDFWAVYDALNTAEHREHLMAGNNTTMHAGPFAMLVLLYADHYGGQVFAPEGDPVRENVAGGGGISWKLDFKNVVNQVGLKTLGMASATSRENAGYDKGWGSLSYAWISAWDTRFQLSFFKGKDFVAWQGNPMYQTGSPYVTFAVNRTTELISRLSVDYGIRADFMSGSVSEYFESPEHKLWVRIGYAFEHLLK